jgi:hypothetical protein
MLCAMLLLRTNAGRGADQSVWRAKAAIYAEVDEVLGALTDPDAIAEWAPVAFEVDGLAEGCLRAGSLRRVSGSIAGIRTTFEVEVHRADTERLELVARGPITLEVAYRFWERDEDVLVEATVGVPRQRGIAAQILSAAVAALLNGGALNSALRRLAAVVSSPACGELVAA